MDPFFVTNFDTVDNMTKIKLELISDPDMDIFFENNMRGGASHIFNRYDKATLSIWNLMTQNKNQNILYT